MSIVCRNNVYIASCYWPSLLMNDEIDGKSITRYCSLFLCIGISLAKAQNNDENYGFEMRRLITNTNGSKTSGKKVNRLFYDPVLNKNILSSIWTDDNIC